MGVLAPVPLRVPAVAIEGEVRHRFYIYEFLAQGSRLPAAMEGEGVLPRKSP